MYPDSTFIPMVWFRCGGTREILIIGNILGGTVGDPRAIRPIPAGIFHWSDRKEGAEPSVARASRVTSVRDGMIGSEIDSIYEDPWLCCSIHE